MNIPPKDIRDDFFITFGRPLEDLWVGGEFDFDLFRQEDLHGMVSDSTEMMDLLLAAFGVEAALVIVRIALYESGMLSQTNVDFARSQIRARRMAQVSRMN